MIGQIRGNLISSSTTMALIDVGGVGYEIEIPLSTSFSLPSAGDEVILHTHMVVREDAQLLYGFSTVRDRDLFRLLIKINGVGPKMGVAILSGLSAEDLALCIENEEISTLVKIPGVGKKTAERLMIEMRDKVRNFIQKEDGSATATTQGRVMPDSESSREEAESALIALGYKPQDASRAVKLVDVALEDTESIIKAALKSMIR